MNSNQFVLIDIGKWILASLIISLHLPFEGSAMVIVQQYIARLGVPLFFTFSGFFIYKMLEEKSKAECLKKWASRIGKLFVFWGTVYFPLLLIDRYNGNIKSTLVDLIKEYILCAPAYLWYLLAALVGSMLLIISYNNDRSLRIFLVLSFIVYCIGVLGNSYLTIVNNRYFYSYIEMFLTTRNGIFFAPCFFAIGGVCWRIYHSGRIIKPVVLWVLIVISYVIFIIEVTFVKQNVPTTLDTSMYFSLPFLVGPIAMVLISKEVNFNNINGKIFRDSSTRIYCSQYLFIFLLYKIFNVNSYIVWVIIVVSCTMFTYKKSKKVLKG